MIKIARSVRKSGYSTFEDAFNEANNSREMFVKDGLFISDFRVDRLEGDWNEEMQEYKIVGWAFEVNAFALREETVEGTK